MVQTYQTGPRKINSKRVLNCSPSFDFNLFFDLVNKRYNFRNSRCGLNKIVAHVYDSGFCSIVRFVVL